MGRGIHCLFDQNPIDYEAMEKAEIKQIADYLKDLEEGLVDEPCRNGP